MGHGQPHLATPPGHDEARSADVSRAGVRRSLHGSRGTEDGPATDELLDLVSCQEVHGGPAEHNEHDREHCRLQSLKDDPDQGRSQDKQGEL
jgi:hypothetical protein